MEIRQVNMIMIRVIDIGYTLSIVEKILSVYFVREEEPRRRGGTAILR
jgi:hypothetical protein